MNTTKFATWAATGLCFLFAACSGGGGSSAQVTVQAVVQDLDLDPNGLTTVITLSGAVDTIDESNLDSDGPQTAVSAVLAGDTITVVWSARITPQHDVRVIGKDSVRATFRSVTTTNSAAPTFVVSDAQQNPGLGADEITLDFSGARVVESEAEDPANWTIEVAGQSMDLTGSTFVLDVPTQVLTITTGPDCNLHADFEIAASDLHSVSDVSLATTLIAGVATGDNTAPSLLSAEQNLTEDEFGVVIDFTFDEAMDPVFATAIGNFVGADGEFALDVEQPAEDVLRVRFNRPMVPGLDQVDLSGIVDAHGNSFVDGTTALAAGSTVANDWAEDPELLTISGASNDTITVLFEQALDPDSADDPTMWELEVDNTPYDLSISTFAYDLGTKTLAITLSDDVRTGDAFVFQASALNPPIDVDGQDFTGTFTGTIGGDVAVPTVTNVVQNRNVDPTGQTVDVVFSEVLDESSAEDDLNYVLTSGNVVSATLLNNGFRVRLVLDDVAVPTIDTLDCSGVEDLAGNGMTAVLAHALISNDQRVPEGYVATATAIEGLDNDQLEVVFTDDMVASDVEDPDNWAAESPIGNVLDLTNATIDYVDATRTAILTFVSATGVALQSDDDFQVGWTTMRDIGGNAISSALLTGDVSAETTLPQIVSVWVETVNPNKLHVRFNESCQGLDDLLGFTSYVIRDALDVVRGSALVAVADADFRGVTLTFGFAIATGSDVLDVSGVRDTSGNPFFTVVGYATEVEDPSELGFDVGNSQLTTLSGERNDVIEIVFDRRPSPWGLLDFNAYEIELLGNPLDLSGASFSFDGNSTVTIVLDALNGPNLTTGATYDLSITGLETAQGVPMSLPSTDSIAAAGDVTAPDLPVGSAKLHAADTLQSILIEMDEAILAADATDTNNILLNGTTNPDSADLVGLRTVRAVFSGGVAAGDTVQVDFRDLAGNLGSVTRVIATEDVSGPLLVSAAGFTVSGVGGDYVEVVFNRQLDLDYALSNTNYTLDNGPNSIDLANSELAWNSSTATVTLYLDDSFELDPNFGITVGASDIYDLAGLVMSPAGSVNGTVGGDVTGPNFSAAFVNLHADAGGTVVDVLFDEAISEAFASSTSQWTISGGQTVLSVERRAEQYWRLELSSPLISGDEVEMLDVPDLAGNLSGPISIAPLL